MKILKTLISRLTFGGYKAKPESTTLFYERQGIKTQKFGKFELARGAGLKSPVILSWEKYKHPTKEYSAEYLCRVSYQSKSLLMSEEIDYVSNNFDDISSEENLERVRAGYLMNEAENFKTITGKDLFPLKLKPAEDGDYEAIFKYESPETEVFGNSQSYEYEVIFRFNPLKMQGCLAFSYFKDNTP